MTKPNCQLCGHPMPEGEEIFNYHGYSGPCPEKPEATEPRLQKAPPNAEPTLTDVLYMHPDILDTEYGQFHEVVISTQDGGCNYYGVARTPMLAQALALEDASKRLKQQHRNVMSLIGALGKEEKIGPAIRLPFGLNLDALEVLNEYLESRGLHASFNQRYDETERQLHRESDVLLIDKL